MPHKTAAARRAYRRKWYRNGGKSVVRRSERRWLTSDKGRAFKSRQKVAASKSRSHLKQHYGLTLGQWTEMLVAQAGRCDCCGKPMLKKGPCVDHDHATGRVRALVCQHCNVGIAWLESRGETLRAAAVYLRRHLDDDEGLPQEVLWAGVSH